MRRITILTLVILLVFAVTTSTHINAAEKPLGTTTEVSDLVITVEFDASVYLEPGTMVAIYGGGAVKLYPLTDEIVIKDLEHVATGQITGKGGNVLTVKPSWKKPEVEIKVGMNVVPLSDEAAPNSPPVQIGEINDAVTPIQSSIPLIFPIYDPEGDDVSFSWELTGEQGRLGFLEAGVTRTPENIWFAPGIESEVVATVTATDSYGQSLICSMKLSASHWDDNWRTRELVPFLRFGDNVSANSIFLTRDSRGRWWSITNDSVFTVSPGWFQSRQFLINQDSNAMASFNNLFHFVGANSAEISVFDSKGKRERTYGIQSNPTDIVIDDEGVVFVADQSLGGIQVYEPTGIFRSTLGRAGAGRDYFSGLARIALDSNGQLYALDRSSGVIHRFGRYQERLPSWTLNLTNKEVAKDLCWHPKGELLVLVNDGRILRLDDQGKNTKQPIEPAISRVYSGDQGPPESVFADVGGEIFVTYPADGIIARYTAGGDLYGIRGAPFWGLSKFAVDGLGGGYATYGDSNTILIMDSEGWITKQVGADDKKSVTFKNPSKLAVSPDGATLVALDPENTQIVRFDLTGSVAPVVFGQPGRNEGQFGTLTAAVMDDYGHIYVLDSKLSRVSVFDRNGQFLFSFGKKGKSDNALRKPTLLAVRPGGQTAYISDGYEIKKFLIDFSKRTATHSSNAGGKGKGPGQILEPVAIACDRQGLLYILDNGRKDLQTIDYRGMNAVPVYSCPYKKWGFEKVSEMAFNVDGKPHLMDSGKLVGLTWAK